MEDEPQPQRRPAMANPHVLDFLVPFREGPVREDVHEWRLPEDAGAQLLALIEASPEAGQPLLDLLCGDDPQERHRVWLSDDTYLTCASRSLLELTPFRMWRTIIYHGESRTHQWSVDNIRQRMNDFRDVHHFLLKVIALGNGIRKTKLSFYLAPQEQNAHFLAAVRDLVSLPRSRRTVVFGTRLSPEAQRAIAYHCNPAVQLPIGSFIWTNVFSLETMCDAMRANRCPTRLSVVNYGVTQSEFSAALEATTRIDELTIDVGVNSERFLNAIGRNRGIRDLVAIQDATSVTVDALKTVWTSIMMSPTIRSVDTSAVSGDKYFFNVDDRDFNEEERRECAELVARLIRTNPRITSLTYHPRAHDARIMETCVIPIVQLNQFRPVLKAALDAPMEDTLSGLVGSPIVRIRPEMMYHLLRTASNRLFGTAARSLPSARRGRARSHQGGDD